MKVRVAKKLSPLSLWNTAKFHYWEKQCLEPPVLFFPPLLLHCPPVPPILRLEGLLICLLEIDVPQAAFLSGAPPLSSISRLEFLNLSGIVNWVKEALFWVCIISIWVRPCQNGLEHFFPHWNGQFVAFLAHFGDVKKQMIKNWSEKSAPWCPFDSSDRSLKLFVQCP